jgi:hypothetical protein
MAITLTTYPTTTDGGTINNCFAGFGAVEIEYKREDAQIISISQGVDNQILISVAGDLTSSLNIGESLYLFASGVSYSYDLNAKIVLIVFGGVNTSVTIESDFIQSASLGYVNYKQNYFLEAKLVDPVNNNIKIYPSLLSDSGTPSGIVKINCSPVVDFLQSEILATSDEISAGRVALVAMYREVWRENQAESFVLQAGDKIVIFYGADNSEQEEFINGFEVPKLWEGYPFIISLLHSTVNNAGEPLTTTFDELNINQDTLTSANALHTFGVNEEGVLQSNFNDNIVAINANTRFLNMIINSNIIFDYETGDYNDNDYLTINTP